MDMDVGIDKLDSWAASIERSLRDGGRTMQQVLEDLLTTRRPARALFVYLSIVSNVRWYNVKECISDPERKRFTPLGRAISNKLRDFLRAAPAHIFDDVPEDGKKRSNYFVYDIGRAVDELNALEAGLIKDPSEVEEPKPAAPAAEVNGDMNEKGSAVTFKFQQDKQAKRTAAEGPSRRLNKQVFNNLNIREPHDKLHARTAVRAAVEEKEVNEFYKLLEEFLTQESVAAYLESEAFAPEKVEVKPAPALPSESQATAALDVEAPDEDVSLLRSGDVAELADVLSQSVFPRVKPMEAARHFEANPDAIWEVQLSQRARKDLEGLRDRTLIKKAVDSITELSKGKFTEHTMKRLTGRAAEYDLPIYEYQTHRDLRIIWTVALDYLFENEKSSIYQFIRVFGLVTHAQMDHTKGLWQAIAYDLQRFTKEYRDQCKQRDWSSASVCKPKAWPGQDKALLEIRHVKEDISPLSEDEKRMLNESHTLTKYTRWSKSLRNSLLVSSSDQVAQLFNPSPTEEEIIDFEGSVFVLGRSGTGKTTCMVFRILLLEQAYKQDQERGGAVSSSLSSNLRLLFITQSSMLTERVKDYYKKLEANFKLADLTPKEANRRFEAKQEQKDDDSALFDDSDDKYGLEALPEKWSELTDEHFPLFLSFSQLCTLLEKEYGIYHSSRLKPSQRAALARMKYGRRVKKRDAVDDSVSEADAVPEATFVDFPVFNLWWKSWNKSLTGRLDPSLVFSEIMGTLRGSEAAMASEKGYISKEQYLELSSRTHDLLADQRDTIYELMLAYERKKAEIDGYDAADRTRALLIAMKARPLPLSQQVRFLSVDEAQDQLLGDCQLLRAMCFNPHGYFFAGDTAQTINHLTFTFESLKAAWWNLEQKDPLVQLKKRDAVQPGQFQLLTNFRSHDGITRLGSFFVEAMVKFWPNSIDRLQAERGERDGPVPIFTTSTDFLKGQEFVGETMTKIEFGADQCIIVRTEDRKKQLESQYGDSLMVLTVSEAKGLEFIDVICEEPFGDSPADKSQWRVLLNMLPPEQHKGAPAFDDNKHALVCQELKQLYVAVTRTCSRLWLHDTSETAPFMSHLLVSKNLVKRAVEGEEKLQNIAQQSTPEEWIKRGGEFLQKSQWEQAARCFRRANRLDLEAHAQASQLQRLASAAKGAAGRDVLTPEVIAAFVAAAQQWVDAASLAESERDRMKFMVNGADHYEYIKRFLEAAQAFEAAKKWNKAITRYQAAGEDDTALDLIAAHYEEVKDGGAYQKVLLLAKINVLRKSDTARSAKLFPDGLTELREFAKENGFDVLAVPFLNDAGAYPEAARILRSHGRLEEAARAYGRSSAADAKRRQLDCLYELLQRDVVLVTGVKNAAESKKSTGKGLLDDCHGILVLCLAETPKDEELLRMQDEIEICRAVVDGDRLKAQAALDSIKANGRTVTPAVELLAADLIVHRPPLLNKASVADMNKTIADNSLYVQAIKTFIDWASTKSYVDDRLRRLFAIGPVGPNDPINEGHLRLYKSSPLISRVRHLSEDRDEVIVNTQDLLAAIRVYLGKRAYERICTHSDETKNAVSLRLPCNNFLLDGKCKTQSCPYEHLSKDKLTTEDLMGRARLLAGQLVLVNQLTWLARLRLDGATGPEVNTRRTLWIDHFFNFFYSPLSLVHISQIDPETFLTKFWPTRALVAVQSEERLWRLNQETATKRQGLAKFMASAWVAYDTRTNFATFADRLPIRTLTELEAKDTGGRQLDDYPRPMPQYLINLLVRLQTSKTIEMGGLREGLTFLRAIYENAQPSLLEPAFVVHTLETVVTLSLVGLRQKKDGGKTFTPFNNLLLPLGMLRSLVLRYSARTFEVITDSFVAELLLCINRTLACIAPIRNDKQQNKTGLQSLDRYREDSFSFNGSPVKPHTMRFFVWRLLRLLLLIAANAPRSIEAVVKQIAQARAVCQPGDALYNDMFTISNLDGVKDRLRWWSESLQGTAEQLYQIRIADFSSDQQPKGIVFLRAPDLTTLAKQLSEKAAEFAVPAPLPPPKGKMSSNKERQRAARKITRWLRPRVELRVKAMTAGRDPEVNKAREVILGSVKVPNPTWSLKGGRQTSTGNRSTLYQKSVYGPTLELFVALRIIVPALQHYRSGTAQRLVKAEQADVDKEHQLHDYLKESVEKFEEIGQDIQGLGDIDVFSTKIADAVDKLRAHCREALTRYDELCAKSGATPGLVKPDGKLNNDAGCRWFGAALRQRINNHFYLAHRGLIQEPAPKKDKKPVAPKKKKPVLKHARWDDPDDDDLSSSDESDPDDEGSEAASAGENSDDDMPPLEAIEDSGDEMAPPNKPAPAKPAQKAASAAKPAAAAPKPAATPKAAPAAAKTAPAKSTSAPAPAPAAGQQSKKQAPSGFAPRYAPPTGSKTNGKTTNGAAAPPPAAAQPKKQAGKGQGAPRYAPPDSDDDELPPLEAVESDDDEEAAPPRAAVVESDSEDEGPEADDVSDADSLPPLEDVVSTDDEAPPVPPTRAAPPKATGNKKKGGKK